MKFSFPSAACRTIGNKRFGLITGNFVITATTKEVMKGHECMMKASQLVP